MRIGDRRRDISRAGQGKRGGCRLGSVRWPAGRFRRNRAAAGQPRLTSHRGARDAVLYKAATFTKNRIEYETSGVSPPCWYPPMTPITVPRPVALLTCARNGPPLVPSA